jgi:hypothetical protein
VIVLYYVLCVKIQNKGFDMDKKVGLSWEERRAILTAILDSRVKKDVIINMESRDYILQPSKHNKKFVITAYNNQHYVVTCDDVVIADSNTFGNNARAKLDIMLLLEKFIDTYNKTLVDKAYGRQK